MGKYAGTQTEKNLLAAFAGESQARNKYTYFSAVAKDEGLEQIAKVFEKTATNEEFLDHEWASVYQIQNPELAVGVGTQVFTFPFSYSGGTTLQEGFLMNCPAGLFLFAGSPVDFTPVALGEEAVIDDTEEEVVDDIDDLDFSMI